MFKRLAKRLKGEPEQPVQAEPDTSSSVPPAPKPDTKTKPEIWSWGLLTGTYNPLPDDADEASTDDSQSEKRRDNKS